MSGPKVVNIEALRRRQKRETAACLRAVEILFADCLRLCQEDEKNHAALEKSILETITRSTALGEANLWGEAVEELRTKQDFLTAEQIHLRERAAARNAERLRIAYRREGMLAQIKVMILSFPDTEHAALFEKFETSKNDPTAIETLIQQISANSVFREASANSQILRNLIAEFQPATVVAKINSAPDPDQSRLDRCWEILGECETFTTYDPALLDSWKRKAADVSAVPPDQRSLRLDSLVLELSAHLRDERERCALLADLEILATEFQAVKSEASAAFLEKIHIALEARNPAPELRTLIVEARACLADEIAKGDAIAQRAAVLRALAACGYEVRQGMETAWIEHGHVVLRKPDESVYGVEFTAPATGTAIQTRVVALAASVRDPRRDKEMEDTWCGDFQNLRNLLESQGFTADLRHATPAGSVAMKILGTEPERNRTEAPPKSRTLG